MSPTCASPQIDPEHTACNGAFMPPAGTCPASRESVAVLEVTACLILAAGRACLAKRETLNAWQWALERCFRIVKPSQQRLLPCAAWVCGWRPRAAEAALRTGSGLAESGNVTCGKGSPVVMRGSPVVVMRAAAYTRCRAKPGRTHLPRSAQPRSKLSRQHQEAACPHADGSQQASQQASRASQA